MIIVRNIILSILLSIFTLSFGTVLADSKELPLTHDNRIRNYIYNENEVFLVNLTFGFQSNIVFAKGEQVKTILLGDTYSWMITPISNRLILKALEKNIRTNMTVITNKRSYYFDLVSSDDNDEYIDSGDKVYVIKFYYPKTKN
jgi:type IV secretion system protein VirB9